MPRGTIKKLVTDKGFGFIATDGDKKDLFFHHSAVANKGFDDLTEGDTVDYEVDHDQKEEKGKGPRAKTVKRLGTRAG